MIDLTLNSFLHPDLVGLKPPFGTIIERTVENKGGLSTAQTDNNMAMPFALMRPVTVATSDTTSKVEYDAKLLLTGDTPLTIHLDDATYQGCTVTIVNGSSAPATISAIRTMNGTSGGSILLPRNNSMTVLWSDGWVSCQTTGQEGHYPQVTGEIIMYMGIHPPKGWLNCDGTEYESAMYPDLAELLLPLPFNVGVAEGIFRVPDMRERFPQGANGNIGQEIEAGLPNIQFNARDKYINNHLQPAVIPIDGALYITKRALNRTSYTESNHSTVGDYYGDDMLTFDASLSSPIYGKSDTVQPPAFRMNYIIKY